MKDRVLRGGSCLDVTWGLRSASRYGDGPGNRRKYYFFRIVFVRRKQ